VKVSVRLHVETELNSKHLIVASCWVFSLHIKHQKVYEQEKHKHTIKITQNRTVMNKSNVAFCLFILVTDLNVRTAYTYCVFELDTVSHTEDKNVEIKMVSPYL
jgi:hypothetical protein